MAAKGPPFSRIEQRSGLSDGNFRAQINVLNGVEKLHAFTHWALECLAAGNEASAAGTLVDHRGGNCFLEVVGSGSATAVDQSRAAHVAIGHLIAAKVDGMVAGEVGINALVEFAVAGIAHVERS